MASRLPLMLLLSFLAVRVDSQPQRSTFRRPAPDPRSRQSSFEGPPPYQPGYQPEKSPSVPIPVGVRSKCKRKESMLVLRYLLILYFVLKLLQLYKQHAKTALIGGAMNEGDLFSLTLYLFPRWQIVTCMWGNWCRNLELEAMNDTIRINVRQTLLHLSSVSSYYSMDMQTSDTMENNPANEYESLI